MHACLAFNARLAISFYLHVFCGLQLYRVAPSTGNHPSAVSKSYGLPRHCSPKAAATRQRCRRQRRHGADSARARACRCCTPPLPLCQSGHKAPTRGPCRKGNGAWLQ